MSTYTDEHAAAADQLLGGWPAEYTITTLREFAAALEAWAGWMEDQLAGGTASKPIVLASVTEARYLAGAARTAAP